MYNCMKSDYFRFYRSISITDWGGEETFFQIHMLN